MKALSLMFLVCTLALASFAQPAKTNAVSEQNSTANKSPSALTLPASAAVISKPFVLTNDCLSQPERTEVADGGKAIFSFTITNAGNYVFRAVVSAPDEDANSFFINVDTTPEDPMMIWDIDVTTGFEERNVNWRGDGDAGNDQFAPRRFKLSAGAHKLIVIGREPGAQLKSISLRPASD